MVKVPHSIIGNTRPTSQGMDPLRVQVDPDAFGAGLARGLGNLGQGLEIMAQKQAQRTEKLDRFQSMSNFSDFEIMVNGRLAELKKSADPTGKGFVETANAMYDKAADEFIAKMVPEDMKMEARYWTSNTRQRIIGDSMNFEFEAGNAYFRAGVDKQYQNALKNLDPKLGGDPSRLPQEKESLKAFIEATDLLPIEKAEMYRTTSVGLEGVVYKQAKKVELQSGGGGGVKGLIRSKEGFRTTPYWDVNAWRIGYGSDTITRADGSVVKVQPGMSVTKDDAERDLDRRVNTEFIPRAKAQVGEREWGALSGAARSALTSNLYNYGSLQPALVLAAKTGNPELIAQELERQKSHNGGVNAARRQQEANMVRGGGEGLDDFSVDDSPLFSNVPYEDRVALSKDAESEYNAEQVAAAEAAKLAYNTKMNDLMNGLNDGRYGQTEIDAARSEWMTDYTDISRAQELYKKRNEDMLAAQRGMELASGFRTADPSSEEDRKSLNAFIGKGGLAKIDGMDAAYLTNGLVPFVTSVGDIPTDVAGLLQGMIRSNNQQKALFAFDALAMLADADERAYKNRIPDDVEADVRFYRMNRTAMEADKLFEAINGGDPAQRQGRRLLQEEAEAILKAKEKGVPKISEMVAEVTSEFDGWTSSAQQLSMPAFAKQLQFDYEAAFIDAYTRKPDVEQAKQMATEAIKRDWGVSEAGGGILMRNPPEKAGYAPVLGSYEWIEKQTREVLGIPATQSYQLISDDKTASEVAAFKRGGPPPSYQIVVLDENGVPRQRMWQPEVGSKGEELSLTTNIPLRINYLKTPAHFALEEMDFEIKNLNAELTEIELEMMEFQGMEDQAPPELRRQRDELYRQRDALQGQFDQQKPSVMTRPAPALTEGLMKGRQMGPINNPFIGILK